MKEIGLGIREMVKAINAFKMATSTKDNLKMVFTNVNWIIALSLGKAGGKGVYKWINGE